MNSINESLRSIRKSKKISYQELADMCGVSKGYIYQIEKGKSDPTLSVINKIASSLDVSLSDLIDVKIDGLSVKERRIINIYRELYKREQNMAYRFICVMNDVYNLELKADE
jgi:transcriptional regulator with XRE-family HTH domain